MSDHHFDQQHRELGKVREASLRMIFAVVWVVLAGYGAYYLSLGAWLAAICMISGCVLWIPLGYTLQIFGYFDASVKMFILAGSSMIVYGTSLGMRHLVRADLYLITGMLTVVLLFDSRRTKTMWGYIAFIMVCFLLIDLGSYDFVPESWLAPMDAPYQSIAQANAIIAISMLLVILSHGLRERASLSARIVSIAEQGRSKLESLSQRQNLILDQAALGAWDWSFESDRVLFDQRCLEILGRQDGDEFYGIASWKRWVHPEDISRMLSRLLSHVEGGSQSFEAVHRIRHQNGEWVWVLNRGKVSEKDSQGQALCFTGTILDVTSMTENQQLLDEIQKIAKIGGWQLDLSSGHLTWTPEVYRIHGLPQGSHVSEQTDLSFFANQDQKRLKRDLQRCKQGHPFRNTYEFYDSQGVHKWVEVAGNPMEDASGKIFRLVGTFQDVSDVHARERSLHAIVTAIDDVIFEVDEDIKVQGVWTQDESNLFVPREFIVGQNLCKVVPSEISVKLVDAIAALQRTQSSQSFRFSMTDQQDVGIPDGDSEQKSRCFIARLHLSTFGAKNSLIVAINDITEIAAAEQEAQRQRSYALQSERLASLGEVVAGIAHEINNPLAILLGQIKLLRKKQVISHQQSELLDKATGRITKIVRSLRKYSRTNDSRTRQWSSLNVIVDEAMTMTWPKAQRHGVEISYKSAIDPFIFCDDIEIEQVMINLINNAIDAIKGAASRWIRIEAVVDRKRLLLRIIDSGTGIDAPIRDKLFQPFFTTKDPGQGTGLGLPISYGIMKDHQGSLRYDERHQHTCFEMCFDNFKEKLDAA